MKKNMNLIQLISICICTTFLLVTGDRINKIKMQQDKKIPSLQLELDSLKTTTRHLEDSFYQNEEVIFEGATLINKAIQNMIQNRNDWLNSANEFSELLASFEEQAIALEENFQSSTIILQNDLQYLEQLKKAANKLKSINSEFVTVDNQKYPKDEN